MVVTVVVVVVVEKVVFLIKIQPINKIMYYVLGLMNYDLWFMPYGL